MHRLLCLLLMLPAAALAQAPSAPQAPAQYRGVYATIDMRPTLNLVQRLDAKAGGTRRPAIREVLKNPSAYTPPVLYALANALSEDDPDDAVFWYHVGRIRAVYDAFRCRDKSAQVALLELRKMVGRGLAAAQFYHRERTLEIAKKAVEWDAKNPQTYDHRWVALRGKVAATSPGTDPNEVTLPESEWPGIKKYVHETHLKSVQEFAAEKKGR